MEIPEVSNHDKDRKKNVDVMNVPEDKTSRTKTKGTETLNRIKF